MFAQSVMILPGSSPMQQHRGKKTHTLTHTHDCPPPPPPPHSTLPSSKDIISPLPYLLRLEAVPWQPAVFWSVLV